MTNKKTTCLAAVAIFLVAFAGISMANYADIAIHAGPAPDLLSMVPPDAPTLVFIDVSALRSSEVYKNRANRAPLTAPNADYAGFVAATGFDFERDLDRVVVASWPKQSAEESERNYVVAEGRFDRAKIRSYAMQHGKVNQQMNHEVFLFPMQANTVGSGWNSMVFLDDNHLAIAEGTNVDPLLAVHAGSAPAPMQERIARMQAAPAYVIVHASAYPNWTDPKNSPVAQFAALARTVEWVSLAFTPEDKNLRVSMEGECKTPEDADQLHTAMELLRQLGKAGISGPEARQKMDAQTSAALQTLIGNLVIKETDNRVRMELVLTPDLLNLVQNPKPARPGIVN